MQRPSEPSLRTITPNQPQTSLAHIVDKIAADFVFGQESYCHTVPSANWLPIAHYCADEGIAASLFPWLDRVVTLPQDARDFLRTHYEHTAMIQALYVQILTELAERCASSGRLVILQGLALTELIYPQPLTRSITDADIFLPNGNIDAAHEALRGMGFSTIGNYANLWERDGISIDVHEDLWGADRIPARRLMAPGVDLTVTPSTRAPGCWVLTANLQTNHTAYHALKHGCARTLWALDILLLYRHHHFDACLRGEGAGICAPLLVYVLKRYAREELSPDLENALTMRQRWVVRLLAKKGKAGTGELILALLARRPGSVVAYLWSSLLPPRRVLEEMYGRAPLPELVGRRALGLLRLSRRGIDV